MDTNNTLKSNRNQTGIDNMFDGVTLHKEFFTPSQFAVIKNKAQKISKYIAEVCQRYQYINELAPLHPQEHEKKMTLKLLNLEDTVRQFCELVGFGCKAVEKIMVVREIAKYSEKLLESDLEFVKSKCFSTVLSFYERRLNQIKKEDKNYIDNTPDDYQLANKELFDFDSFIAAVEENSAALAYARSSPKSRAEVSKQLIIRSASCVAKYSKKTSSVVLSEQMSVSNDEIDKNDDCDIIKSDVGEVFSKDSKNNISRYGNTSSDDKTTINKEDGSGGDDVNRNKIYIIDGEVESNDDSYNENKKERVADKRKESTFCGISKNFKVFRKNLKSFIPGFKLIVHDDKANSCGDKDDNVDESNKNKSFTHLKSKTGEIITDNQESVNFENFLTSTDLNLIEEETVELYDLYFKYCLVKSFYPKSMTLVRKVVVNLELNSIETKAKNLLLLFTRTPKNLQVRHQALTIWLEVNLDFLANASKSRAQLLTCEKLQKYYKEMGGGNHYVGVL